MLAHKSSHTMRIGHRMCKHGNGTCQPWCWVRLMPDSPQKAMLWTCKVFEDISCVTITVPTLLILDSKTQGFKDDFAQDVSWLPIPKNPLVCCDGRLRNAIQQLFQEKPRFRWCEHFLSFKLTEQSQTSQYYRYGSDPMARWKCMKKVIASSKGSVSSEP